MWFARDVGPIISAVRLSSQNSALFCPTVNHTTHLEKSMPVDYTLFEKGTVCLFAKFIYRACRHITFICIKTRLRAYNYVHCPQMSEALSVLCSETSLSILVYENISKDK